MGREGNNWIIRWRAGRSDQQQADDDYTSAEKLLDAVNDTARTLRANYFTFLLACSYMGIIIASTTDVMLLKESPVTLPLLNVQLPVTSFYAVMPWLVVLLHFYLMLHHYLLADRLYKLDGCIQAWPNQMKKELHSRLISLPFIQLLISGNGHGWVMRGLLKVIVLITLTVFPLMLLCWAQMRFLPYHHEAITANHRYAIFVDVVILWFFWLKIVSCSVRQWFKRLFQLQRIVNYTVWVCNWTVVKIQRLLKAESSSFFRQCKDWIKFNRPIEGRADWSMSLILFTLIALTLSIFSTVPYGQKTYLATAKHGISLPAGCFDDEHHQAGTQFENYLLALFEHVSGNWIHIDKTQKHCMVKVTYWRYANGSDDEGAANVLSFSRHLDLREQMLIGNKLSAETLHALKAGNVEERKAALKQVIGLNLQKRDLRFARLSQARLYYADLREVELQGAELTEAQLQGADLRGAVLRRADLRHADLWSADLRHADLRGANLWRSDLTDADLSDADLSDANLSDVNLRGAKLSGINLSGANLSGMDLIDANLSGINLSGADLSSMNLSGANLSGADLSDADLSGADLSGADLREADLSDANLSDANLNGADLSATNL